MPSPGIRVGGLHTLLVETVRDYAIFALDAEGRILTWNAGARQLKGYEAEEIVGQHFSIFYPEEQVASGHPDWELEVAAEVGRYEEEGWRLRKDGTRFWANVVITALRDDAGELVGYAKVTRDLTERMRAERALRESEERFRLLVESVQDYGIFMLDPDGRVASWNEGAEQIKGYTEEEILGEHFSIFFPAEDVEAGKPDEELRQADRVGRYEEEGWRVRKDGGRFWANVVLTALRNDAGELIGYAKVTRDLTERHEAQLRALEDARRVAEAKAESQAKSEFLAALSHELRTPLNAIAGYVQLLGDGIQGPVNEQQAASLERIRRSQKHLLALINDLLNYSRLDAGRVSYDLRPVALAEMVEAVRSMIEPQAAAKEITMSWKEADPDTMVRADGPKAEQVLLNLLTNAVKYTEPGGHVQVRTGVRDDRVAIEVEDDGIGIPEERFESIFEPFVQVGRTLSSPHEGTGLGLAISRDLARAMDGDLTVRSRVDHGSTFTFTLPRSGDG